jgi:hypothetical protein
MAITFASLAQCLPHVTAIRKPVLLRAKHGVGKSACVYAFAQQVGLPVVERRASQMTEGDLLGLPKLNNDVTRWCPPDWLKTACSEPVVLFIDEIDRATPEVRQGFFELTDSRKIAGWTLNEGTLIFAAINGGEAGAQYQVGEMDPAELDRWTVFDLEPSVEDWLNWAAENNNIDVIVRDYIRENPKFLEHAGDFEPNKVYPSRRSWHRFNDCVVSGDLLKPGEVNPVLFNLACAFIGLETAFSFQDYVKTLKKKVTLEDVIDNGRIDLTKDFDINQHMALIDKLDETRDLEALTDKNIENLRQYFFKLPSEVAMKFYNNISAKNQKFMIKFNALNGVAMRIVKMINGECEEEKEEIKKEAAEAKEASEPQKRKRGRPRKNS